MAKLEEYINKAVFNAIFNQRSVGVYIASVRGAIQKVNNKYCEILGYEDVELYKLNISNIIFSEDMHSEKPEILKSKDNSLVLERRYVRKDGVISWVNEVIVPVYNETGELYQYICTVQDINEYKNREIRNFEAEKKYRNLFESMATGVSVRDTKGYFTDVNPALSRMLGYSKEELKSRPFIEITHPEDVNKDWELYKELIDGKRDFYAIEKRYIHKNGSYVWGNLRVTVVKDNNGEIINIIEIVLDITENKEAQEKILMLNNDLEKRVKDRTNSLEMVYGELAMESESHKKTDNALHASEMRYRQLVEELPMAICVHVKNKLVFINPAGAKLLSYEKPEAIVGQDVFKFLHKCEWRDIEGIVNDDNINEKEYLSKPKHRKLLGKNGEVIDVEIMSIEITYENQDSILTVVSDITERMEMEKQLRENFGRQSILNEIYRLTTQESDMDLLIDDTIAILDRYIDVDGFGLFLKGSHNNELSLHRYVGLDAGLINSIKKSNIGEVAYGVNVSNKEVQSFKFEDLFDKETNFVAEKDGFTHSICYPLKTGGQLLGAFCVLNKENRPISELDQELLVAVCKQLSALLQNAQLFIALNDELDEKKRTEKELRKLNWVIEQSPVSVIITDPRGSITYVNPRFSEVTGYEINEVLGRNPRILNSGELPSEFYNNLWSTITAGGIWQGEFHNKKKNGELYWEAASISPISDEKGVITNYVSIKEDITGIKSIAEELRKAKEEAEKANNSKSIFLANMSHEIRTPMNAILGFSQLLMKDNEVSTKQRDYLESISRSGEHLISLINDILEMSKIDAGRVLLMPSVFDINTLVHDVERMLKERSLNKNLEFNIVLDEKLNRFILADENKIRQIFINLIGNAIKFTETGSIVWSMRSDESENGELRLISDIEDTGPGIPGKDLLRLFKAFEQTETGIKAGGTGLGLTISQRFAKMMGGEISVTSQVGKGSCFHVELDVISQSKINIKANTIYPNVIGIKNVNEKNKILIVDDIKENRFWLSELLKSVGFQIREGSNGIEAITIFEEWSPDIILMDIRMPIMDGYEATKRIKGTEKGKLTPVIAITASVFEDEKNKITNSGISGYILKPFKEKELFEAIAKASNIKYLYDTNYSKITLCDEEELEDESIEALPSGLVEAMREAIINGDLDTLIVLIDEAALVIPVKCNVLRGLANNYQFEALLEVFK